jgi:aquaporin Z
MSNGRYARFTGLAAGTMVGVYIFIEAPLSGMSLNPARSFASAVLSGGLSTLWIYFAAPCLGMAVAAVLFTRRRGLRAVLCAKLNHAGAGPCIFCETPASPAAGPAL